MATNGGEIELKFSADTSEVVAAAQRVEASVAKAMDESAKSTDNLNRALQTQGVQSKALTSATVKLTSGMDSLGDKASKAGGAFAKVAGAASMVAPEFGELFRAGADVADVFEVAGSAGTGLVSTIASLAVPIGIAAAALASMVAVVNDYSSGKKEAIRVTEQFAAMMAPLDAALESARSEHQLLTQAQAAGKDALKEYTEVAALHTSIDAKVAETTAVAREEREKHVKALAAETKQHSQAAIIAKDRIAKLDQEIGLAEQQGRELKRYAEANRDLKMGIESVTDAKVKDAKVEVDAADKVKEQIDALRESIAARAEARKVESDYIQASAEREMAAIFQTIDAEKYAAEERAKLAQEATEQAERQAAAEKQMQEDRINGAASMFGSIAALASASRDAMSEKDREAAMTAFAVEKASGLAQAGINAFLAISEAIASAPFPANIPSVIGATAQGAANVTAIASVPPPKFHTGTSRVGNAVQSRASAMAGEVATVLTSDEAVLTGSAADRMGRRNVDAMNAGMDPFADRRTSGGNYTVIGSRAHGYFIRDDVRQRTPLAAAIRGNSGVRAGLRRR